jgi:hypothetical protein
MKEDLLLLHIAKTQYAQGQVLAHILDTLHKLAAAGKVAVDPALAAALAESKSHHDQLKAVLDAQP